MNEKKKQAQLSKKSQQLLQVMNQLNLHPHLHQQQQQQQQQQQSQQQQQINQQNNQKHQQQQINMRNTAVKIDIQMQQQQQQQQLRLQQQHQQLQKEEEYVAGSLLDKFTIDQNHVSIQPQQQYQQQQQPQNNSQIPIITFQPNINKQMSTAVETATNVNNKLTTGATIISKPLTGGKVKRFGNIGGGAAHVLGGQSRNINNSLLNNFTQNAVIYQKNNESPYREMLLNKTQEIRGINRSPIGMSNNNRLITNYQQNLTQALIVNKSVLSEVNLTNPNINNNHNHNNTSTNPIVIPQIASQQQQQQQNDATNASVENSTTQQQPQHPLILKQSLIQRQKTLGTNSQGGNNINRLSKSPQPPNILPQELKNDKKLQKIHNIYLNNNPHHQMLSALGGSNKSGVNNDHHNHHGQFQSQQIQSQSHQQQQQSNIFIQHKRKIKPSTAGNPSSNSKQYLQLSNSNLHQQQQQQQQFSYNFLPYDNNNNNNNNLLFKQQARSKSPQKKFLGQPKYSHQNLSATTNTNNETSATRKDNMMMHSNQSIDQHSQSLSKHIDNLFTKKKYSLQPPSSSIINNNSSNNNNNNNNNFTNYSDQNILNSTQQQLGTSTTSYTIQQHQNNHQEKNKATNIDHNNNSNNSIFMIRKNSLKGNKNHNKFIDSNKLLNKTTTNINIATITNNNNQQQQYSVGGIKIGSNIRDDALEKLTKLLQRQKQNQQQQQQSHQSIVNQQFNGLQKIKTNEQLENKSKEYLALGGKLSKTQIYSISNIMNEQDDNNNNNIDNTASNYQHDKNVNINLTLSTSKLTEQQEQQQTNNNNNNNNNNSYFDIQTLSTPRMMILPSDDFSEIENPESIMKKQQEENANNNINTNASSQHHVSEFDVESSQQQQQQQQLQQQQQHQQYYIDDTMTRKQQIQNLIVEEMQPLYYFNIKPISNIETDFDEQQQYEQVDNQTLHNFVGNNNLNNNQILFTNVIATGGYNNKNNHQFSGMKEASTPFFLGSPANQNQSTNTTQTNKQNNTQSLIGGNLNLQNIIQSHNTQQQQQQQYQQKIMTFEQANYGSFGGSHRSNEENL